MLAVLAGATGCTHNYYYGNAVPLCPEAAAPVTTFGQLCEVPTQVSGGTVAGTVTSQPTIVASAPRPRRVVVSQPRDGEPLRSSGRLSWRQTDPESIPTTSVSGAFDNESRTR
jgi:hypothetical protein